ncbi:hypothetical protein B0H63DRAFT_454593 [Podospora didyma]|uniref:Rhodopsin domain-containing protein n=1 Tax=Podospora didyma TaxID=330526 RepID=A0AAE0N4F6_9PEZI|nr:hypothetical protein B0H63DRAFT_454593 [Podospora didyma]
MNVTGDPPGADESNIGRLLGPVITLYVISFVLLTMRLTTRIHSKMRLGLDDITVALALLISTINFGFILSAVPHGMGRHNYYVSLDDQLEASHMLFYSQMPWGWGVCFSKISIAFLLLRFKTTTRWRVFLYAMIAVQVASAISANVVQLTLCKPLAASWDFRITDGVCHYSNAHLSMWLNGGIAIATDLIFAAIPLSFLGSIRRPLVERLVVALLMGIGVITAVASAVKLTMAKKYGSSNSQDPGWDCIDLIAWSVIEEQLGVIAACVPCLKSPFEKMMRRLGLLKDSEPSIYINRPDDTRRAPHSNGAFGKFAVSEKDDLDMMEQQQSRSYSMRSNPVDVVKDLETSESSTDSITTVRDEARH